LIGDRYCVLSAKYRHSLCLIKSFAINALDKCPGFVPVSCGKALLTYNRAMPDDDAIPLGQRLHLETGRITWPELQRYFARGVIIIVNPSLDLIDIAQHVARNQTEAIDRLIQNGQLLRAADEHALDWQSRLPDFWAVVVAPWVLVQEALPQKL
jgi:hypothetical protein